MRAYTSPLMLLGVFAPVCAQDRTPEILSNASHCLVVEQQDWLELSKSKATSLTLGYVVDTKSYPGEKHVFVIAHTGKCEGKVFDLKVETRGAKQVFTIENNASFVHSSEGVSFVDLPLGGVWTQEHLQSAVVRIEGKSKVTLSTEDLRRLLAQTECRSYAEK